jgi:hypothetical protein
MSTTDFSSGAHTTHDTPREEDADSESSSAKEQAQQAAGTAKDEGKRVASVAKDEAQSVAEEAKNQARGLLDEATSQLDSQSQEQKTRLAGTVRTFGEDLDSMRSQGEGSDGIAGQLVQQVADQARSLASHLDDRQPRELLEDVRGFARRRPGTFLLGALTAGVVVGRLTRGAKAAQNQTPSTRSPVTTHARTAHPTTPSSTPTVATGESGTGTAPHPPASTDLGTKGIEMSESGIIGIEGEHA